MLDTFCSLTSISTSWLICNSFINYRQALIGSTQCHACTLLSFTGGIIMIVIDCTFVCVFQVFGRIVLVEEESLHKLSEQIKGYC